MSTTKIDLNAFYIDNLHTITSDEGCLSVLIDLISTDDIRTIQIAVLPNNMVLVPVMSTVPNLPGTTMEIETLQGLNLDDDVMAVLMPLVEYCFSAGSTDDVPHLNGIQNMYDNDELEYEAFVPASTILHIVMGLVDEHNDHSYDPVE